MHISFTFFGRKYKFWPSVSAIRLPPIAFIDAGWSHTLSIFSHSHIYFFSFFFFIYLFYTSFHFKMFWCSPTNSLCTFIPIFPSLRNIFWTHIPRHAYMPHAYISIHLCKHKPTFKHPNIYISLPFYMPTQIYAYRLTCLYIYLCICLLTFTSACIHTNMRTSLHEYLTTCPNFYCTYAY